MTRKIPLYALAALLACLPASARAACQMTKIVEMPVTMDDLVPTVAGEVNGHEAHFIADSGAFFSMLTKTAAKRFEAPLKTGPNNLVVMGAGGMEKMQFTQARDLTLLGHIYHDVDFMVGGDGALGRQVDGLLGQNFFQAADAEFDLADGAIRLFKEQGCEGIAPTYWMAGKPEGIELMRISSASDAKIRGEAWVNGHKIWVMFDTGAGASIISLAAAEHLGLTPSTPGAEQAGLTGGIGRGRVQSWIVPVKSFQLAGEEIKNTKLRIADIALPDVDMLIGADFFLSHRVYVAYRRRELYFTYNGGPVFDLSIHAADGPSGQTVAAAPSSEAPKDAAGFARRGAAWSARKQYAEALADYDRAIELEPTSADHFYQRALIREAQEKPDLALADLDKALKLKPDHLHALMLRGELLLDKHDLAAARADLAAAWKSEDDPDLGLEIATLYQDKDQFEDAVASFDQWLATHPDNVHEIYALNGRCWARALWNRELDKALVDCDRAVSLAPFSTDLRDSRALVWLRMNQLPRAIGDYNFALHGQSKSAWSLYGRGVAETRRGDTARGQADIAEAEKLDPKTPERARRLAILP